MYHLLHMANLRSVLERGLLSRREIDARDIDISSLQSVAVQCARKTELSFPDGSRKPLDYFVTFRWLPSSPILANLAYDWVVGGYSRERQEFLVLLEVDVEALDAADEVWFVTESPFSRDAVLLGKDKFELIPWDRLRQARERHGDFSDRICSSEILVSSVVPPAHFHSCVVCSDRAASRLRLLGVELSIRVKPEWFFGCQIGEESRAY